MRPDWQVTPLGKFIKQSKKRVKVQDGFEYPAVGVMMEGRGFITRTPFVGGVTTYKQLTPIEPNQLVLRSITAWEAPIQVTTEEQLGFHVSGVFPVFDIDSSILNPRFLSLLCRYEPFWESMRERTVGSVLRRKTLSATALMEIPIQLPPFSEQKRIVDLISSVDSYIEALQQQQNFSRQILQALCQKAFLVEGDFVQLHTVATCIMGQSPEGSTCNKDGIGTPLLTGPTEFQRNNWVGPPRQWTTNETKISISQDILFCVRGATAGRMNLTNYRSVIGRGLAAIRCDDPMDTHFVRFALQFGLNQLLPSAGGTIFPNISQSQLRGFNLPWPNETERRSLASLLKSVEDNAETLDQNLATTKNLRSSLLHDLLSGEQEIPTSYDKVMGAA